MSIPTETERKEIAEELNRHYGGFEITANHICNAVILENYSPDSPGWAGEIWHWSFMVEGHVSKIFFLQDK